MELQGISLSDGCSLVEGAHGISSLGICTVPTLWVQKSGHLCFKYLSWGLVLGLVRLSTDLTVNSELVLSVSSSTVLTEEDNGATTAGALVVAKPVDDRLAEVPPSAGAEDVSAGTAKDVLSFVAAAKDVGLFSVATILPMAALSGLLLAVFIYS